MKIGIIGCGNMGGAIARALTESAPGGRQPILLYDKEIGKADQLASIIKGKRVSLAEVSEAPSILVIAVKPQDAGSLFNEISAGMGKSTIVSVMAGVKMAKITAMLGKQKPVIRVMPNVAAFVKEGMSAMCRNKLVAEGVFGKVKNIFCTIGEVIEVKESDMDSVTAVSGSGPAYLFYLADSMMKAAKRTGLKSTAADKLVRQTLYGASLLLKLRENSPEELIKTVASKGGTTEAALKVFKQKGLNAIVNEAVQKAKKRSKELG